MEKKGDARDFERGIVVGGRRAGLSIKKQQQTKEEKMTLAQASLGLTEYSVEKRREDGQTGWK